MQRAKPRQVFDRHRTESGAHEVLAAGGTPTTFLVEPGERPFQADARLNRRGRSGSRVHRLVGLEPLREYALLQNPVEVQSGQRAHSFDSWAALEDADGRLWFGIGGELVEIRGPEILHHGPIDGASNSTAITGIARDGDGHLLVADSYRVCEFVPPSPGKLRGEWLRRLVLPSRPNGRIRTLLVDDAGALWLGTGQGLMKYVDGKASELNP